MIGKHQKTLHAFFADPVRSNINWVDIEALLMALGKVSVAAKKSGARLNSWILQTLEHSTEHLS